MPQIGGAFEKTTRSEAIYLNIFGLTTHPGPLWGLLSRLAQTLAREVIFWRLAGI